MVVPAAHKEYPLVDFEMIHKSLSQIQMLLSDLDLAYKIIHRAFFVKTKLKHLNIILDDTCPLCSNAPETIEQLFVPCGVVQ